MRYGPGQHGGLGRHGRPVSRHLVGLHLVEQAKRSKALAQREGGVGAVPHAHHSRVGVDPTYALARSVELHRQGHHREAAVIAHNAGVLKQYRSAVRPKPVIDVYHAPIVGHTGLLGGLEDLAKTFDPIALGKTLKGNVQHPLRGLHGKPGQISAGVVVGGPEGGFRLARSSSDRFVNPSPKTIAAKPGETRIVERPATIEEARKRLRVLDRQLEGFYKRAERLTGHPLAEPDIAQEYGRSSLPRFGKRARGRSVEGRVTGAPVKRSSVSEQLRSAAIDRLEEIAKRNPNHPSIKAWKAAEAERAHLTQALHGHLPGEAPSGNLGTVAEIARTPEAEVRRALGAMRMGNREVEALRREERAARMARGEAAHQAAGGGVEGYKAFLREQRGALPDIPLDRLSDASKADVDRLFRVIDEHPGLKRWEKVAAQRAIDRLVGEGRRPRPHEVKHLNTVFGPQFTENLVHTTLAQRAVGVLGIPRSVMASFDVSAPFRQNLMGMAMEPRIGLRNLGPMYRSFGSEGHYAADLANIHAHPDYQFAIDSGLSITELAGKPGKREEAFPSQYAEQIPVAGHIVRGSGRAYTGYLDNVRFQIFAKYVDILRRKGIDPESYPELRGVAKVARLGREYPHTYAEGIAKLVNSATGRGHIKGVESWGPFMNVMFFSPRLMYSRINFLDPTWYFRLDPFSRRQALKGVARLSTTAAGSFALASYLGAQIGHDPRSADFAKIRLGNTRVDILGGFQQYIRLAAQLYTGEIVSSTTGKTMHLGGGFGQQNRLSILARFAEGKLAPPASLVVDFFRGTDFAGQPFKWKYELLKRITPLVAQDVLELYRSSGSAPLTALAYLVSAHGVGIQTYGPKQKPPVNLVGGSAPRTSGGSSNSLLRSGSGSNSHSLLRGP